LTPNENLNRHRGGRPRKEVDREELKRLLKEGRSLREIARTMKRGYGSVYRASKDL
jgi:DNA invertase Pin-like site-specific DNA recombinase